MSNYLFFSLNIIFLFNTFALGTTFEERFKCTSWSSKNISAPKAWSISYLSVPPRKNASSTLTPQRLKVLITLSWVGADLAVTKAVQLEIYQ